MRLFIGIPLPSDISRAAAAAQNALIDYGVTGRFVLRENFHITLHFIGNSDALVDAADAIRASVRDIRPFVLRIADYGCFGGHGDSGHTGVLHVSDPSKELSRLYETLESELWERGFTKNRSTLTPHITLGRNLVGDGGFTLQKQSAAFTATHVILFESRSVGGQMQYTPIHKEPIT